MIKSIKLLANKLKEIQEYSWILSAKKCKDNLVDKLIRFEPGINIIVGRNGSGKSTLLNIMKCLTLCAESYITSTDYGTFGRLHIENRFLNAFKVANMKADYNLRSFNLLSAAKDSNEVESFDDYKDYFAEKELSSGEYVRRSVIKMMNTMFGHFNNDVLDDETLNKFFKGSILKYYKKNNLNSENKVYTVFLDEPDKGLDITNLKDCLAPIYMHRSDTQVIAVVHNPLVIYKLHKQGEVNFIEFTPGYVDEVCSAVEEFVK